MLDPSHETYSFGEFTLDVSNHLFMRGQEELSLNKTPFKALVFLVKNPNKLITRTALIDAVYGEAVALTPDAPKKWVDQIRGALGNQEFMLETIYGEGWRFRARVSVNYPGKNSNESSEDNGTTDEDLEPIQSHQRVEPSESTSPVSISTKEDASDERPLYMTPQTIPLDVSDSQGNTDLPSFGPFGEKIVLANQDEFSRTPIEETQDKTAEGTVESSKYQIETFEGWLGGPGLQVFVCVVICITGTVVLSAFVASKFSPPIGMQAASGAQCVTIMLATIYSWLWGKAKGFKPGNQCSESAILRAGFKNRAEFEEDRERLEHDLKKYSLYWRLLLVSWIPLYVVFALGDFGRLAKVLLVIFNLFNTFILGACFSALNKNIDDQDREHIAGSVLNIVVLVVLAGVLIALLLNGEFDGATLLTGIMGGITMALYVGRLQSRFLGPRFWILYLLYSYTAIQPLALYINQYPGWGWKILDFALLLKCLLFLYMTWLFHSGLLLFYFAKVKRTDVAVHDQRQAFQTLIQ